MNRYNKQLIALLLAFCLSFTIIQSVQALSFSLLTFENLIDKSPTIIVGQVVKKKDDQEHHLYTVDVLLQKKGVSINSNITVQVLRWADEGKLNSGDVYLLFLTGSDPYEVVGIHQGIVGIDLETGEYTTRFYSIEDIEERFPLENYQDRLYQSAHANKGLLKGAIVGSSAVPYALLVIAFLVGAVPAFYYIRKKRSQPKVKRLEDYLK